MKTLVLVPVKNQSNAKQRMAPILTEKERASLAWAMFTDVASALDPLGVDVGLVTNSRLAAAHARSRGWEVLWEPFQISESASVDLAARHFARLGFDAMLRLPADLPLVRTEDIAALLEGDTEPASALLVPSRDRMGTNAILRSPPDLFPSRFGHNSLVLHTQEALRAGAHLKIVENPRIALDLDDPSDLARFMESATDTETYRLLSSLNIRERIC